MPLNAVPKVAIVACLSLGVLASLLVARSLAMHNAVPLQVMPARFALGQVVEGSIVSRTALIRNTSTFPLHVERLYTSCGCTTAHLNTVLNPGETVPLQIRFDSHDKPGTINKRVLLFLTEYPNHPIEVPLSGHVTQLFRASPDRLSFGTLKLQGTAASHFTLSRLDGTALKVFGFEKSAHLQATVRNKDAKTALVTVSVHAPDLPGDYQETLTLGVNEPTVPHFAIPVRFHVSEVYHLSPEAINFGLVQLGRTIQTQVHISGADVSHLKLSSAPIGMITTLKRISSHECLLTVNYKVKGERRKQPHS